MTAPETKISKPASSGRAAFYAVIYPWLVPIARANGYCLAIHGSVVRDFDLIAVPWTEDAVDPLTLILALKNATKTITHHSEFDELSPDCAPTLREHGRIAYSLHFTDRGCDGPYMDVSVMPRVQSNWEI